MSSFKKIFKFIFNNKNKHTEPPKTNIDNNQEIEYSETDMFETYLPFENDKQIKQLKKEINKIDEKRMKSYENYSGLSNIEREYLIEQVLDIKILNGEERQWAIQEFRANPLDHVLKNLIGMEKLPEKIESIFQGLQNITGIGDVREKSIQSPADDGKIAQILGISTGEREIFV